MNNLPEDWNTFYLPCGCHESEGGCSCIEQPEYPKDECKRTWLALSDYEFDEEHGCWVKLISINKHTARRDHKDGKILKGEQYRVTTERIIDDLTGDKWMHQTKRRIS